MKNNSGNGSIPPDGDIEVLLVDGKPQSAQENPDKADTVPTGQTAAGSKDTSDKMEKTSSTAQAGTGYGVEEDITAPVAGKEDDELQEEQSSDGFSSNAADDSENDDTETISEDEYALSEEEAEEIASEIAKALQEAKEAEEKEKQAEHEQIDLPGIEQKYPNVQCQNIRVPVPPEEALSEQYAQIVAQQSGSINSLTNQLKRIFRNDAEEREYRTSGKVCIKRLINGTVSPRVFERKRQPGNKSDISILMLIDESGSMAGSIDRSNVMSESKIITAQKAAILLAEVFGNLHIPIKVVGFTESGRIVQHYHYLSWVNTPIERTKLMTISARSSNFDGYAIRYASELLQKRPERHKMLIVISDGMPASIYYQNMESGAADTRNAIQQASKEAKVCGVLVGNTDAETLQWMYGVNFLQIKQVEDLPQMLGKKIRNLIKEW